MTLLLEHWPASVRTTILAGHLRAGFSVSLIVTVKLQVLVLPTASVAAQLTVATPLLKVKPEGGLQTTVAPGQLSVTKAV